MKKTCGNCVYMLDDGDGSKPYCARRDLYYNVQPRQKGCVDWRSNENKLECGLARYHAELMKRGVKPWQ